MDLFFIEYRDPIFGVIVLCSIVFCIAFSSYLWGIFSTRDRAKRLKRFIDKFSASTSLSPKHKQMLLDFDLDTPTLSLLANAFVKSGDFDKAISVYLIALDKAKDAQSREFILTELSSVYFKAGFLERSAEVCTQALRLRARNLSALGLYVVICERLRRFDDALDALEALQELGADERMAKAYIKAQIILSDKSLSLDERIAKAMECCKDFSLLGRMCMQAYFSQNKSLKGFKGFPELSSVIDIVFYQNETINLINPQYEALLYARGDLTQLTAQASKELEASFELRALASLRRCGFERASLSFGYVCKSCKSSLPMHFYRCPTCNKLASVEILPHLTEIDGENSMAF